MKNEAYILKRIKHFILCVGIPLFLVIYIPFKTDLNNVDDLIIRFIYFVVFLWFFVGLPLFFLLEHEVKQ